jgi:multidrug transporter EmrE-like cation transporter
MKMNYRLIDLVGNLGVGMIVVTYLLLQLDKIKSSDVAYSVLNALGASLIVASLIVDFNLSALLMETFWVLISLLGIVRHWRPKTITSEP